jgi:hypothetical protein
MKLHEIYESYLKFCLRVGVFPMEYERWRQVSEHAGLELVLSPNGQRPSHA